MQDKIMQDKIDSITYPPTHDYKIKGMIPIGVLSERVELFEDVCSEFFQGERLLDIGCNKGFFSLYGDFKEVVGIDTDLACVNLCKELGINAIHKGFRDYISYEQFDRIFIGNGPHHLFIECGGWEWIAKLAAYTAPGGLVMMEGGYDLKCKDVAIIMPRRLRHIFTQNKFLKMVEKYFIIKEKRPAVSYTPDRYIYLLERRPFKPFIKGVHIKKKYKKDVFIDNKKMDVLIASFSPISNGLVGFTEDGWYEVKSNSRLYVYFENEIELFKKICRHQIFLSKIGYMELDFATINFFKPSMILFDKGGVMEIGRINEPYLRGVDKMYSQSYNSIPEEIFQLILNTLKTKDSKRIEVVFKWAITQL